MTGFVRFAVASWALLSLGCIAPAAEPVTIESRVQLLTPQAVDQDDFCFWIHPTSPADSVVIASDKSGNAIFVYDLQGHPLQTIAMPKPGNIDIRQNVMFDGQPVDLVVVNQRTEGTKLRVFQVDRGTRQLARIDRDDILTGPNYGGCLTLDAGTGALSFLSTSSDGAVEQIEIRGDGVGGVTGKKMRSWPLGKCEGAVADDETGMFYITEEGRGIWKVGTKPGSSTPGELIAKVGQDGLKGDLEGIALFRQPGGRGCLVISDQGRDCYVALDRQTPHKYLGEFKVNGASQTDGIEIGQQIVTSQFPEGLFACHTNLGKRPVLLSSWADAKKALRLP
jgi:3-phytase